MEDTLVQFSSSYSPKEVAKAATRDKDQVSIQSRAIQAEAGHLSIMQGLYSTIHHYNPECLFMLLLYNSVVYTNIIPLFQMQWGSEAHVWFRVILNNKKEITLQI